ncbi:MAG: cob(I)yrinic acid a,c-diamide adenosyltransferase [Acidilobaceae archaeon]|nr:cob(I)yrinic acid a,c-diamide adenosyltransferase [Acidilobaceae archaeon]MCX8166198.1 cob(I)yrinic acid a,c-diamide adenosyltransferase [Acidilobaceae archaeon]MDW7974836.1 cob(I)yrinic acid a,c-diamide adenosyltransferase [Sulfolobales archaeon]
MGKLYTRGGDGGFTYTPVLGRVEKDHPLVEFYGALDEANSMIGLARGLLREQTQEYEEDLRYLQELLYRIGFSLTRMRVSEEDVKRLEEIVDRHYSQPLQKFILPTGPAGVAALHAARSQVRRAERRLVALRKAGVSVDDLLIAVMNRMSDSLFAIAVAASRRLGFEPEELNV